MAAESVVEQNRVIPAFNRIFLSDYGELTIIQGAAEALSIQCHPDLLPRIRSDVTNSELRLGLASWTDRIVDAFTTSLTRKTIAYKVTVRNLEALEVKAAATVAAFGLRSNELRIKLRGPVSLKVQDLRGLELHVDASGATMEFEGKVEQQRVQLHGLGTYRAQGLCSKSAIVRAEGACQAWVWAEDTLDYMTGGLATVEYSGSPHVRARNAGAPVPPFVPRPPRIR